MYYSILHRFFYCFFTVIIYHSNLVSAIAPDYELGETIRFKSSNPFSFYHIITALDNQSPQDVYGILRMPTNSFDKPIPLVIGVNGSKNWADHHLEYLAMYREMGFATFELQSFNSRNIKSTVGEQISVTTATMILDAYMALDKLSRDIRFDKNNIAITGWSLGGGVALFSAWKPIIDAIGVVPKFSQHLAFYPPCLVDIELIDFSKSPIHILIGELDDWVTAEACENLVDDLSQEGVNIGITVYENAHHGFDREGPIQIEKNGYATGDCHFRMREDGALLMNIFNIPMITPFRQKVSLALCAKRGTKIGGNPIARKASFDFAKTFLNQNLVNE